MVSWEESSIASMFTMLIGVGSWKYVDMNVHPSGQSIATSHDLTPKGSV